MRFISKSKAYLTLPYFRRKVSALSSLSSTSNTYLGSGSSKTRRASTPLTSTKSFSTASIESLQKQGILDDRELLQFNTLHELQKNACIAFSDNDIFGTFVENKEKGEFEWMTYNEFGEKVDQCRCVLRDLGVKEFSKIGIISNNRWEWTVIASAAYSLNATLVPMYEAQLSKEWAYITNDAECDVLVCATQDVYDRTVLEVLPQTPSVKATLCLDAPEGDPFAFATHMAFAAKHSPSESTVVKPTPDDLANLIYTSGTTGKPKGVELIHSNTVSNIFGVRTMVDNPKEFIRESDRSLAFLPWAHSYGQTCELWCGLAHGTSMGICRGIPFILEDLQLVKPTVLFAVPTLHKKIYDGVHNLIETSTPLRKGLMTKALALGRKKVEQKNGKYEMNLIEKLQYDALDKMVLSKIRDRFGGRLRHGFVAGAACPSEVINFLDDIGIPICEGYGLTETSPIITLNTPINRSPGYVGKAIPGVEVVVMGEDGFPCAPGVEGEICCYGPNVMRGYYKNPEATEQVLSLAPDGKSRLFHTGDLGKLDSSGWLKVTGRLKEQYKLENGKYVCPTPIEEAIGMSRFVMQVVLCGANRPYNVALIVPDWIAIKNKLGIDLPDDELGNDERVHRLVMEDIESKCSNIKKFERPKDFEFVAPFTAANNMLTPKMSIRRHMVIREYNDVIAAMYNDGVDKEEHHRKVAA